MQSSRASVRLLIAASVTVVAGSVSGAANVPASAASNLPAPRSESARHEETRTVGYDYLLSLPEQYASEPARRWPLLVFLHGSGECGHDLNRVPVNGPPKFLRAGADLTPAERIAAGRLAREFIVVSPQCPDEGIAWLDDDVVAVIDQVCARDRVDVNRIYLTGISMGGYGVWDLALHHADRFAAVVPISGGGSWLEALNALDGTAPHAGDLLRLPVWAVQGAKDDIVPPEEGRRLANALTKAGNTRVRLTIDPERGHDVWNSFYADAEFYDWLLAQRRTRESADTKSMK
jgi:predicted peptidase